MKVFISADIEGVAGIAHWDEARRTSPDYAVFRQQLQAEVQAACEGAVAAGATAIRIKDAHASARNLEHGGLPRCTELIRGWSEHPLMMIQEIDASYAGLVLIGYHSPAGSGGHPLAHTLSGKIARMRVNGEVIAELHLFAVAAAALGVPTVFVSGDAVLCGIAQQLVPGIQTVSTTQGIGESVLCRHPATVSAEIRAGVRAGLLAPPALPQRPGPYSLEIDYVKPGRAYRCSFYPGARLVGDRTVKIELDDWMELLRALVFIT